MQMQHHFTVPVPIDVAWPALLDLERVAPCMPGATLTKSDGKEFAGSVKVRLGPISLLYKGNGSFTEIDAEARRVVIDASGKDSRGNGTAAATVTAVLTSEGERTSVQVDTDLKVTGKPAQLGRGMIAEVGGKIIDQFAECLADRLAGPGETETTSAAGATETGTADTAAEGVNGDGRAATQSALQVTSGTARPAPQPAEDAIDLLGTAGVPVLKRVLPVVGGLFLLIIVLRLVRRRRR